MIRLFTNEDYDNAKANDNLACQCYNCKETFFTVKKNITFELKNKRGRVKFCSQKCNLLYNKKIEKIKKFCINCNTVIYKYKSELIKTKKSFCSLSCAATYNNKHKSHGNRRSKLEIWLEKQLTILYPNLEIHYNQKSAINSELDIYLPSLNIAFELNGIFHYEPIYGIDKLNQIKENDISKTKACHEEKIDLCIIDTSQQTYFKPSTITPPTGYCAPL